MKRELKDSDEVAILPKWPFLGVIFKILTTVIAVVAAVLCCFAVGRYTTYSNYCSKAAADLPAAAAAYRATGLPWVASDLEPNPALSGDQNGAAWLEEAAAEIDWDGWETMRKKAQARLANGRADQALEALRPLNYALRLVAIGLKKPGFDWHPDYDATEVGEVRASGHLHDLEAALWLRAEAEADNGAAEAVLDDARLAIDLGEVVWDHHRLYDVSIWLSHAKDDNLHLERCASALAGNEHYLASLENLISRQPSDSFMTDCFRGQAYNAVTSTRNYSEEIEDYRPPITLSTQDSSDETRRPVTRSGLPVNLKGRIAMDLVLRFWTRAVSITGQPPRLDESRWQQFGALMDSFTSGPIGAEFPSRLRLEFDWFASDFKIMQTNAIMAKLYMECLRDRVKAGHFPTETSQVPGGPWEDPLAGTTFVGSGPDDGKIRLRSDKNHLDVYIAGLKLSSWEVSEIDVSYPAIRPKSESDATDGD